MQSLPLITIVFSLLIQEKQQRSANILPTLVDPIALIGTKNNASTMTIFNDRTRKSKGLTCSH